VVCRFGDGDVAVAPSGRLYPCERLVGEDTREELRIGDVEHGIDVGVRDRMLAQKSVVDPECAACELRGRCKHWCGCTNWETTGSLGRFSPLVCWLERSFIAEADRVASTLWAEKNPTFMRRFYRPAIGPT